MAIVAENRNLVLDYAKAICIVLMVIGHCCAFGQLIFFIYTFHMPCFFFVSGMVLSDQCIENINYGIKRKLYSYYLSFIKCVVIFILLHNFFVYLGLIDCYYSLTDTVIKILRVFILRNNEKLIIPLWFVASLSVVSVMTVIYCSIMCKKRKLDTVSVSMLILFSLLAAYLASNEMVMSVIPMMKIVLLSLSFYAMGYLFRKNDLINSKLIDYGWIMYIVCFIVSLYEKLEFFQVSGVSVLIFFLTGICGSIATLSVCRKLCSLGINNYVVYIGQHTFVIMLFNYLSFRFVNFAYALMSDLTICEAVQCNVLYPNNWLWIVYTLVAVLLPLLISRVFRQIILFVIFRNQCKSA